MEVVHARASLAESTSVDVEYFNCRGCAYQPSSYHDPWNTLQLL